MSARRRLLALLLPCLLAVGCAGGEPAPKPEPEQARDRVRAAVTGTEPLARVRGPLVVAVGDIACPPGESVTEDGCRHRGTARLARSLKPRLVLLLGDTQYDDGKFAEYRKSFDSSWGAMRGLRPVPGNHEYHTHHARGYYRYFRDQSPAHPGWYSFRVGSWRIFALNSNCGEVSCHKQSRWLNWAMKRFDRRCSAIMMHHPRYSSGDVHGSTTEVKALWEVALRHRTDVALAGHDHVYERFRRMNAAGQPAKHGILSFVAGAGGRSLYGFDRPEKGSLVRDNRAAGVLALRLGQRGFAWKYRTIDGRTVDTGMRRCV